eukprot:scaffold31109_cov175-Amphora_coffeaeformis.AAC.3
MKLDSKDHDMDVDNVVGTLVSITTIPCLPSDSCVDNMRFDRVAQMKAFGRKAIYEPQYEPTKEEEHLRTCERKRFFLQSLQSNKTAMIKYDAAVERTQARAFVLKSFV